MLSRCLIDTHCCYIKNAIRGAEMLSCMKGAANKSLTDRSGLEIRMHVRTGGPCVQVDGIIELVDCPPRTALQGQSASLLSGEIVD